ncbi:MAG: RNA polymerase factor sigma-54 [Nitrospiraceae bacterium]|nr:RNA polymerase factor sigma-54 [Nitrospiraceae bacterium]
MALDNRLEIRLLQKLILTPQLQQAIKLLQMPQLELTPFLTNELMENPFLEEAAEEGPSPEEEFGTGSGEAGLETGEAAPEGAAFDEAEAPLEKLMDMPVSDDYFEDRSQDGRDLGYFNPGTVAQPSFENFVSREGDLQEHLLWQLRLSSVPPDLLEAARAVIGNIDENGYLRASDEDIASIAACTTEEAGQAVRLVQDFDPTGVGARDLQECLLIQLRHLGLGEGLPMKLIASNLRDLEKKRYNHLARQYDCTVGDIVAAVRVIEKLEPKPGRNFSNAQPVYVTPDVYIVKTYGEFQVVLNDAGMPKIRLSNVYKKLLSQRNSLPKEEKHFIDEKLRQAVWLLKSLDQRNKTIYRVADSILKFQRDFFEMGRMHLKPLNLRDMATELGLHESTISRATASKYLTCDHGLFSLKFFFSGGVQGSLGKVSSTSVKDMIKKMISEEDRKKPLSDQEVVALCKGGGIEIARRTVAKYRKELGIAPQNQRKRFD